MRKSASSKNFSVSGPLLLKTEVFLDLRGYFLEAWRAEKYKEFGINYSFVQDNFSMSNRGVLRGLHFQANYPQGKIITVLTGAIYDVAVDLRVSSPTFSGWIAAKLGGRHPNQLWIPPGFAHGYYTLEDNTLISYKCTEYYHPEDQHTILWSDSDLDIKWPIDVEPILSINDQKGKTFKELESLLLTK